MPRKIGNFKTGRTKTGGRKKGTPNKLTSEIRAALLEMLEAMRGRNVGVKNIVDKTFQNKPEVLIGALARIAPREITLETGTDTEIHLHFGNIKPPIKNDSD